MTDYAKFVARLAKHPSRVILDDQKVDLWHGATGVAGESGELLDLIKKHVINGHPLDVDKVIKELGDIEFYLQMIRNRLGLPRELIIETNVKKLSARYSSGSYSDNQSIQRYDERRTLTQVLDDLEQQPEMIVVSQVVYDELINSGKMIDGYVGSTQIKLLGFG